MSIRTRLSGCVAVALLGTSALMACAKDANLPPKEATGQALMAKRLATAEASRRAAEAAAPARSHLLGTIARKAIGPIAARVNDSGIAVWIVGTEHGGLAQLVAAPFGADGSPLRAPRVVATVPREATSLVVRPTGRSRGGWLVAWTALLDRGESLSLLELAPDGGARGTPADLQRTSDHVTWTDLVATAHGALCVWAEETSAGDANILTVTVDSNGRPRGVPSRVARGVERWAAVSANDGAALALVTRDKSSSAGLLSWVRLDAEGSPQGPPTSIGKEPTVSGDIDVVPFRDGWLLAWTDGTGEDPQVTLATVDASGHVQGPTRTIGAAGGSSLVALAAGADRIALAWQTPHRRTSPWHLLHLASVSSEGGLVAQPVTSFQMLEQTATEFLAAEDGFALLTTPVPSCYTTESSGRPATSNGAGDCRVVPTFLRYDAKLSPVQAEPLYVGEPRTPATLAWGLRCEADGCVALASTAEAPTPVYAIDLRRRKSPFASPTSPVSAVGVARVTGRVTLESGQPYIDLAAARLGDATLVATLTNGVDSSGERAKHGQGPKISVRAFDDKGRALENEVQLTSRAVAVGRVAIAAAEGPEAAAAVAWVARDDGDPQVHLARIDGRGRLAKEIQLTTVKGDASSVAIASAANGWLIAWVDSRDGNGEVYATKVDRNLNRLAPDQRVTRAPGDAADVALKVVGDVAWLAWSDPRESPREGVGDVYVAQLRARDAKRTGDEVRVLATAAHSRSPEIAAVGDGVLVAWIEDTPSGVDAAGAAMVARLGANGRVVGSPTALVLGGEGRPTGLALTASPHGARTVVARSGRDGVTLDALAFSTDGQAEAAWPVVDLDAPAPFEVALALAGDGLLYDDTGAVAGDHRIRRLTISW